GPRSSGTPESRFNSANKIPPPCRRRRMIVDFQHHFIPRELAKEPAGLKAGIRFDKDGVPSMTPNSVLYDLDEHIRMMDGAGIDAAFLTCPPGMCVENDLSRFINDKTKDAERQFPGRFIGG